MKQKIMMKVDVHCQKHRSKGYEDRRGCDGVISVAIEGKDQDQLVVIGDGVDSTCLVMRLRKKVAYTNLITVEEVKPPKEEKPVDEKPQCQPPCYGYPYVVGFEVIEERRPSICSTFFP